MKKIIALALVLMMSLTLVACGGGGSDSNTIVYGTSADYPPFEFHILEDGVDKVVGLDVALAYEIADDMGKTLSITEMNFDNLLTLMAKGDCDFVIAAMESTPEREEAASCSDPYYTDLPAMVLVRKADVGLYNSLADFSGKTVGAQSGTTKADIVTDEMDGADPLLMQSVVDLVNNLANNKCDALVLDGAVAMQYAATNDDLVIAEAVELGEAFPYRVWVAKGDPKGLLDDINKTIAKVLADGSMDKFIAEADELSSQALEG